MIDVFLFSKSEYNQVVVEDDLECPPPKLEVAQFKQLAMKCRNVRTSLPLAPMFGLVAESQF